MPSLIVLLIKCQTVQLRFRLDVTSFYPNPHNIEIIMWRLDELKNRKYKHDTNT